MERNLAFRLIYLLLLKHSEEGLKIMIDLAKEQTLDNPEILKLTEEYYKLCLKKWK